MPATDTADEPGSGHDISSGVDAIGATSIGVTVGATAWSGQSSVVAASEQSLFHAYSSSEGGAAANALRFVGAAPPHARSKSSRKHSTEPIDASN